MCYSCCAYSFAIVGPEGKPGKDGQFVAAYRSKAYASDNEGGNFSFTYDESLHRYKGEVYKISTTVPEDPTPEEFEGKWELMRGADADNRGYPTFQFFSSEYETFYVVYPFNWKAAPGSNSNLISEDTSLENRIVLDDQTVHLADVTYGIRGKNAANFVFGLIITKI